MIEWSGDPDVRIFKENKITLVELNQDFWHITIDNKKIIVPKGFISDGASIPMSLWALAGHPLQCDNLKAALIHDFLCKTGQELKKQGIKYEYSWRDAHAIFKNALINLGVPAWKAKTMESVLVTKWLLCSSVRW